MRTIGRHCEKNINECLGNPCINGICIDSLNGYDCECHPGFFGLNCDSQIKPCPTEHNRGSIAGPTKMESTKIELQICTIPLPSPTSNLDNYLQLGISDTMFNDDLCQNITQNEQKLKDGSKG